MVLKIRDAPLEFLTFVRLRRDPYPGSLLEACNNNRPVNPARSMRDRMFKGPKTPIRCPCVKTKALRTK